MQNSNVGWNGYVPPPSGEGWGEGNFLQNNPIFGKIYQAIQAQISHSMH